MATIVSHGSIARGGVAPMDGGESYSTPGWGRKGWKEEVGDEQPRLSRCGSSWCLWTSGEKRRHLGTMADVRRSC
ncbi:hypothetical protein CCMA1212_004858 [Trichoderma ghanense]|uniref:Uncharacterized protein n=1 Tax=Trichoderma ghanense TaxID=65468 RepID=A0ABY2H5L9_9HYPO